VLVAPAILQMVLYVTIIYVSNLGMFFRHAAGYGLPVSLSLLAETEHLSSFDLERLPMTLTYELDLDLAKINHYVVYRISVGQRSNFVQNLSGHRNNDWTK